MLGYKWYPGQHKNRTKQNKTKQNRTEHPLLFLFVLCCSFLLLLVVAILGCFTSIFFINLGLALSFLVVLGCSRSFFLWFFVVLGYSWLFFVALGFFMVSLCFFPMFLDDILGLGFGYIYTFNDCFFLLQIKFLFYFKVPSSLLSSLSKWVISR